MQTDRFIAMLVAYYGVDAAKEELRLTVISDYVSQYTDEQRKTLFNKLIASFVPTATNTFPIVSHMLSMMHTEADDEKAAVEAWRQLAIKSNRYSSIAIEDPRTAYALDRVGGWMTFCDRTVDGEVFMRRDFIAAFKSAKDAMLDNRVKTYRGELDNADKHMLYLGNETAIKAAILEQKTEPVMVAFDEALAKVQGRTA